MVMKIYKDSEGISQYAQDLENGLLYRPLKYNHRKLWSPQASSDNDVVKEESNE